MRKHKCLGISLLIGSLLIGIALLTRVLATRQEPSGPATATVTVTTATQAPTATPESLPPTQVTTVPQGSDAVPMVEVPAGEFLMGSDYEDVVRWNTAETILGHQQYQLCGARSPLEYLRYTG